jgi:hypothetical protein
MMGMPDLLKILIRVIFSSYIKFFEGFHFVFPLECFNCDRRLRRDDLLLDQIWKKNSIKALCG